MNHSKRVFKSFTFRGIIELPFTLFDEQIEVGFQYEGYEFHVTALTASIQARTATSLDGGLARRSHHPAVGLGELQLFISALPLLLFLLQFDHTRPNCSKNSSSSVGLLFKPKQSIPAGMRRCEFNGRWQLGHRQAAKGHVGIKGAVIVKIKFQRCPLIACCYHCMLSTIID